MNGRQNTPSDIFDTRVRVRDVLFFFLFPLRLLWTVFKGVVPPTRAGADCIWREQERIRIQCHAPDPLEILLSDAERERAREGQRRGEKDAPVPSREKLFKHLRMVWVVRTIAFCVTVGTLCVLAALLLSRVRVKTVAVSGNVRYGDAVLLESLGVAVGDELYAFSPEAAAAALKEKCPYLATVKLERSFGGTVILTVTERESAWRLTIGSRVFVLDRDLTVLEIGGQGDFDALPALLVSGDTAGTPAVGEALTVSAEERSLIGAFGEAMRNLPETEGALLNLSDRYRIRLCLRDGSVILLHGGTNPATVLPTAVTSMLRYRVETGDSRPLSVNVGENGSISLTVRTEETGTDSENGTDGEQRDE